MMIYQYSWKGLKVEYPQSHQGIKWVKMFRLFTSPEKKDTMKTISLRGFDRSSVILGIIAAPFLIRGGNHSHYKIF